MTMISSLSEQGREPGSGPEGSGQSENGRRRRKPWTPPRLESTNLLDIGAAPINNPSTNDGSTSYTS